MPYLITRADDYGSSFGANNAIIQAVQGNFIRNVSCMAVGPRIEEGADFIRESGCCLGLHAVLNSEWDRWKWHPCSSPEKIRSLLTATGDFPPTTTWFVQNPPDISEIIYEFDSQLDTLAKLKIPVSYVDMHMMPYAEIPELRKEMSAWIAQKGLIDHIGLYRTPKQFEPIASTELNQAEKNWKSWLELMSDGQYFALMHPCVLNEESLLIGNREHDGLYVAKCRDTEYQLIASGYLEQCCQECGIETISYVQAVEMGFNQEDSI